MLPWSTATVWTRLHFGALAFLGVGLLAILIPQWRHNADLAHGWTTPLASFLLLVESRKKQPSRFLADGTAAAATTVLCLLGLSLTVAGGLFMAALEWSHSLVTATFACAFCAYFAACWLGAASTQTRQFPFGWSGAVAILLWLLSAPLPPGTYATLTLALQSLVTQVVLGALHLLGIAAVRHGNILQLPHVAVGVEEACSGIRSLLSCVYAGLLFSATLRTAASRIGIVVLGALLAVLANIVRSLVLTLLAHHGTDIGGSWHDFTGYAIIALTTVALAFAAHHLRKRATAATVPGAAQPPAAKAADLPLRWPAPLLSGALLLGLVIATGLFFASRTPSNRQTVLPDLSLLLPRHVEGWSTEVNTDVQRFSAQLQTDVLTQVSYFREYSSGKRGEVTVYVAFWPAETVPVSVVASHTPDACWPGSGWVLQKETVRRVPLRIKDRVIDDAEERIFMQNEQIQHVWYWHLYGGRVIHPDDVRSPRHLLVLAWKYGFRRSGDQTFVRISSNLPWEDLASDPLIDEIFTRLSRFGL